jgi:hypothetical protein
MPKVYIEVSTMLEGKGNNILTRNFKPDQFDLKMLYIFDNWIVDCVGHSTVLDTQLMKMNMKFHGG